uniref:SLC41A/MgtE integral membrane domain-containing protein n=1 Tax=Globodera rostochiensis TaxID=31243 RepID=A0A914H2G4_GLORO
MDQVHIDEAPASENRFSDHSKDENCTALSQCGGKNPPERKEESPRSFIVETVVPFVLAGFSMVGAGALLFHASKTHFIVKMPVVLVLVPALLGLKGNLEMTMSSRLSTMANLGQLDVPLRQLFAMLFSNIAVNQTQAIIVAMIASLVAITTDLLDGNGFDSARSLCLVVSATVSCSVTSMMLTSLMVFIVITARRCGLNPDNIVTPLAAATGDVVSLSFLILFGNWFFKLYEKYLEALVIFFYLVIISLPMWTFVAVLTPATRNVLKHGWYAILIAMLISISGGYILRHAVDSFPSATLLQPVINGVGGNLVAVQASRLATYLHQFGKQGILPANTLVTYANPFRTFACKERESNNAVILLMMSVPGHVLFIGMLLLTGKTNELPNWSFFLLFLCATTLQVATLLYCCQLLCRCLWRFRLNPDLSAIPLLTAFGDFLGAGLLALAFIIHAAASPEIYNSANQQNSTTMTVYPTISL